MAVTSEDKNRIDIKMPLKAQLSKYSMYTLYLTLLLFFFLRESFYKSAENLSNSPNYHRMTLKQTVPNVYTEYVQLRSKWLSILFCDKLFLR